ncbi:MAG TPA: RDD family protein [Caulobacteraceae bacterium]|jgi:uncharacterized RDD family membrane protein YckC|nr:RDD family protein [Caulobacteraceae bacterium]
MADAGGRIRELITPEGVDLRLRLGEAAERLGALVLDLLIMFAIMLAMSIGSCSVIAATGVSKNNSGTFQAVAVIWLLVFFLVRNAYFVLFELGPRAATPGKRAMGLRVAARNGGRLTSDMVLARNFMRELELFVPLSFIFAGGQGVDGWLKLLGLIWCAIFVFFPLFNRDRLRVGDLVAGTWVVKAPKTTLLPDLASEGEVRLADFVFTQAQLDAYGVYELQVLEDVLRRRDRKTLQSVADRIRAKIGWTRGASEMDGDFLSAYYAALRRRLEGRLLFGKRKKDKFDNS